MVPEGSLGLMAGTMPYQLMYLFILVTFFVYLANRQLVERAAYAAGAELARRHTPAKETACSRRLPAHGGYLLTAATCSRLLPAHGGGRIQQGRKPIRQNLRA